MTEPAAPYPPLAELVPHEPPMLLVDELVEWTPERAHVRATLRSGGPFVEEGQVSATALVEYMAQSVAVAEGMSRRVAGRPGVGLLLGSRELEFEVESVPVGATVDIFVEQRFASDQMAAYACELRRDDERAVAGVLNVMNASVEQVQG